MIKQNFGQAITGLGKRLGSRSGRSADSGFSNWAGNQTCEPGQIISPTSTDQVVDIVNRAIANRTRVKAVGSGHSFTGIALTDAALLRLDNLCHLEAPDVATGQITVGAGIGLRALNLELDRRGLALANLGDIDAQSLAGATATATHGTGAHLQSLSSGIVGFELVTGDGQVLWCDADDNSEIFRVGRASIGALGIVTRIRLQCVPAFVLQATERVQDLWQVMGSWDEFITSADHAELFFVPGTNQAFTKQNRRTDAPANPSSKLAHFVEKEIGENVAFDLALRAARRFPRQRDRIASAMVSAASERDAVDASFRVFASPRRVRFVEMEYAVPLEVLGEVVERLDGIAMGLSRPPLFPVEVRCSAADDVALSMAYGRATGWVAVHQYRGIDHREYFGQVEAIMADYDGRPHWGKLHTQTHETLRTRYPEWDRFQAVRAELDPHAVFANDYLDRVLGPI